MVSLCRWGQEGLVKGLGLNQLPVSLTLRAWDRNVVAGKGKWVGFSSAWGNLVLQGGWGPGQALEDLARTRDGGGCRGLSHHFPSRERAGGSTRFGGRIGLGLGSPAE